MSFEIGKHVSYVKHVFELCFASVWGSNIDNRT